MFKSGVTTGEFPSQSKNMYGVVFFECYHFVPTALAFIESTILFSYCKIVVSRIPKCECTSLSNSSNEKI